VKAALFRSMRVCVVLCVMAIGCPHGPEARQVLWSELCRRSAVLLLSARLREAEKNQRGGGQPVSMIPMSVLVQEWR
jgi:hypothetical protein